MDKNKTKHKNMFFKKLFIFESRLIFMTEKPGEKPGASAEKPEKQDQQKTPEKNKIDEYKENYDLFIGKNTEVRVEFGKKEKFTPEKAGRKILDSLKKKVGNNLSNTKIFRKFSNELVFDIAELIEKNIGRINDNFPLKIQLGPGSSLSFYKKGNKKSFREFNMLTDAPRFKEAEEKKATIELERKEVKTIGSENRAAMIEEVKEDIASENFVDRLISGKGKQYLESADNGIYTVNFIGKNGKIDRTAEKETKIHDLFDLSRLKGGDMYIRIYVEGKSPSGVEHKYWAVYHPSQGTFYKEGSTERAKIFNGTKISQITYQAHKPQEKEQLPQANEKDKAKAVSVEETKNLEEIRNQAIRKTELSILERNKNYVFKNKDFKVPRILRDDSDFEANWDKINQGLEAVLTRAPFNLKTTEERRVYIQETIQKGWNDNLNAEDFFEKPVNGQLLYKGGYEKFKKDYEKSTQNKAELEQLAIGIGKVFEALKNLKLSEKKPETSADKYRPKFLGLEKQSVLTKETSEAEKARMTETISYSAYGDQSLGALLHSKENAPRNFYVGVTNKNINEINALALENGDGIEGLNILDLVKEDGGLKLLFMTFGLDELIKRGCIKRVPSSKENKYVLVKVPQEGWKEAFKVLAKNKAKLRDNSKENYNKWETVRAAVSEGIRSRRFILKIFSPKGSKVTQDLNWWHRLFNEKEKKVTMAYLRESSTINPQEFEKYLASDRGYLDMMKKTSERHGETGIYEPTEKNVLKTTNEYLKQGLNYAFKLNVKSESENAVESVTNKILKDFNILSLKNELKKPLNKNKLENLGIIFKRIELKNLDTSKLSKAYIRMIQMGYVETRNFETMGLQAEKLEATGLSKQEPYRSIQEEALKNGLPEEKLPDLEKKIAMTLFALANGTIPEGVKLAAGGLGASVLIGDFKGKKMYLHFGMAGVKNGKNIPLTAFAGVSGDIGKLGGFKFKYNVGLSPNFTGAALTMEHKLKGNWDFVASAGVGISIDEFDKFVGVGFGVKWNQARAEIEAKNKELGTRNLGEIEENLKAGNYDEAVKLILANPTFGDYMKFIKNTYKFPNSVLIEIYQAAKEGWAEKAKEGVKIPFVQGAGVGIGVSKSSIGIGPYVTIKIPGTEALFVVRHEHPKYSGYWQTKITEESLKKRLREATGTEPVISGHTMKVQSGNLFFDSETGGANVELGIGELKKRQEGNIKGTFEAVKSKFNEMDMHVELVRHPENSNDTLLAITPLNTEGSNVEILIDPKLQKKGIVLDQKNGRILLAASEAKKLFFTRSEYRYPFAERGAMNLEVITFKDNAERTDEQIREDSPRILYKPMGSRYMVVKGEARTGLSEAESNTMTIEEYQKRAKTFENFKDRKFEYSLDESTEMTKKMWEALRPKEAAPIRADVVKATSEKYLKNNAKSFEKAIAYANTPSKEAALKVEVFKNLKNIDKSLNHRELNLIYNYMLDKVFLKLKEKNKNVINQRLERRNELFRSYIKNYISDYEKNNPDQWAAIVKDYPSTTPDSIANYLMLTMPQNAEQLEEFSKEENALAIGENVKFASYTKKDGKDTLATSYGTEIPKDFKEIFRMVGPRKLKLDSQNPTERAAARIIFETMSPLETKNLNSVEEKEKFLKSELSLILISMFARYEENENKKMISPLIEILGKENYKGMTEIYEAMGRDRMALELALSKPENEKAFNEFKELVTGIRNAQLEGKQSYIYKNKYEFTLDKTEVYSGAYLKCGNGTIAIRQQIGINLIAGQEENVDWSGAREGANVLVNAKSTKTAGKVTLALGVNINFEDKTLKNPPPQDEEPDKGSPMSDTESNSGETPVGENHPEM